MNEIIDNLMQQHLEDPADESIRGVLLDALLDAGRKRDWHKVKREWEPRAWLKAKGRRPCEDNGGANEFWFYALDDSSGYEEHYWWVPAILSRFWADDDPDSEASWSCVGGGKYFETSEEAIENFCSEWNRLKKEQQNYLWAWNPPA